MFCNKHTNKPIQINILKYNIQVGTFCIFFWCIERPLELLWKTRDLNFNSSTLLILQSIHYILFPLTIHGFIWCIVWRYYMIYYNIKFYEENINMKWKIIINYNMNVKNKTANWFLVNRKRYGSIEWLSPRLCIIFILLQSILIFTQFYDQLIASILDGIISFFSIPILFILWYKTPIIDHFHIGMEYVYIIILCLIEWCFYFGGSLINMILFGTINTIKYQDEITFIFIQSWTGILFAFCVITICTKWTLYKCNIKVINSINKIPTPRNTSVRSLRSLSAVGSNSAIIHNKINHFQRKLSAISPRGRSLKLYECLQCNQGFNCHLIIIHVIIVYHYHHQYKKDHLHIIHIIHIIHNKNMLLHYLHQNYMAGFDLIFPDLC